MRLAAERRPLDIQLQPNPLPDGTLRAQVFADTAATNMGFDTGEPGLPGFSGHIFDTLGEIQTDVYGNPLCTSYRGENPVTFEIPLGSLDADMLPVPIAGSGGKCLSDSTGMLAIPHLGPNRYTVMVSPPDNGQTWIQTTTLEGNHDYDVWLMPGDTGYSTILAHGGEPTPDPLFGFVQATDTMSAGSGHIKGVVVGIKTYTPPKGGSFDFWGGNTGTKVGGPIKKPWLSLQDLGAGDTAVWIGQGNANGEFDIADVPDGNYSLSWWDEPQDYNLNMINVTISNGETISMGQLPLNGWWTEFDGYVFNDSNRNGVKDPGEPGVSNFTLTLRHRENNLLRPRPEHGHNRRERSLLLRERLPDRGVDGPRGLQRQLLHHRRDVPGRQPADANNGQGRRCRRERHAHHRAGRSYGLGRPRL